MTSSPISPSDDDVLAAIHVSRESHPDLGVSKLQAAILSENPTWTLSENRLRKILKRQTATTDGSSPALDGDDAVTPSTPPPKKAIYPSSKLNDELNIEQWTKKVQVKVFNNTKGKGLVAAQDMKEGETIWKEEPFVYCPAWPIQDAQNASHRCAQCALPLSQSKFTSISCTHATAGCPAVWCSRLCSSRSLASHPFLCPAQNPASIPLARMAREETWIALGAWTRVVAVLLGEWVANPNSVGKSKEWKVVRGLAAMSLRERLKIVPDWQATAQANEVLWRKAHTLYIEAFDAPPDASHVKKLAKLKKNKVLPPEIHAELFEYESFLVSLGKMSLNLEAHGAIYTLHSHLNHSCAPNTSIRHLDGPSLPGRITIVAKRSISAGEELLVSYVDPEEALGMRRRRLREWNFGECRCARCVKEEGEERRRAKGKVEVEVEVEDGGKDEVVGAAESRDGDGAAKDSGINIGNGSLAGLEEELRDVLGI